MTGTGSVLDIDSGVTDGLGDSSTLTLSTNAKLNLDANVNEKLGTLMLDGAPQPNGTYGSSQSSAANKLDLYFTGTGVITVGPSILVGDYNSNGFVDAADYVTWRQNIGQPSQTLANDTTGVIVGNAQYALWRTGFGSTTPAPAGSLAEGGAAVPEPSSVGLLILALATLVAIGAFRGLNGFSKLSSGR